MLRLVLAIAVLIGPGLAAAQTYLDDRRIVAQRDVDFFGSDLRSIFDASLDLCRQACTAETACAGFTFNTRSRACFLKSQLVDSQPYVGALSARMVSRAPGAEATAAARAADLGFLIPADFDAARSEALALPLRHAGDGRSALDALATARLARGQGDPAAALEMTGMALAVSDTTDLWVGYGRLALDMPLSDPEAARQMRDRAMAAATAGYLRATAAADQAAALDLMARALERTGRGPASLGALRLAQTILPSPERASRLDLAQGKYGFRVTGSRVDSDSESPRLCIAFSGDLVQAGVDYAPFVQTAAPGLAVSAEGSDLCLDGVLHGSRYQVTLRAGLPAADGQTLTAPVSQSQYVRDRAPALRFAGRGFVLPRGGPAAVPLISVNAPVADIVISRVSDRAMTQAIQAQIFGQPVPRWRQDQFADEIATEVWRGTAELETTLNRDTTTRLPLADVAGALTTGVYVVQAALPDADPYGAPPATQWVLVSDLGLSTLSGQDGLHVLVRRLSDAGAAEKVALRLISRANAVLGETVSDDAGYARFAPGLTRGTGGAAPALLVAEGADGDLALLPLTGPEFDLSDRGVEGRPPAGPVDVFLTTERGIYRAGDTIHATALVRDDTSRALPGLPLTAILSRPDGVEYSRQTLTGDRAGGHVIGLTTLPSVPRGTWRLAVFADTAAPPLASTAVLIEDFLPERIDADLSLPDTPLRPGAAVPLSVSARYLFGAPAPDLQVSGSLRLRPAAGLAAWPGFAFGRQDRDAPGATDILPDARTDATGVARLDLRLPDIPAPDRPMEAVVSVTVTEGSGRPIEREITRPVAAAAPMIGLRPLFDGTVPEGGEAAFDVIALGPDGAPLALPVRWTVNRVETRYQWFSLYGDWQWEPVTRRVRVAGGEAMTGPDPLRLSAAVDWGRHELVVERLGGDYVAASQGFDAGWYAAGDSLDTPDVLSLSLDAARYAPGDTARLRIASRATGQADVMVVSDRLIARRTVAVTADEDLIVDLPVTGDWGTGAYVLARVIAPVDAARGRVPVRALGLAHATVDPGDKRLSATFEGPTAIRPRGPLEVALRVTDAAPDAGAVWATIAAVDIGILNVTGFDSPDPAAHYFGQRRLGLGLRDLYGRLIDGTQGAMGRLRQGGDASGSLRMQAAPPGDRPVAFFSGPVQVGADGLARARFDLPAFNGTLRLMAVVWSDTAIGQARSDITVRDPVVAQATLPRFLSPGDSASMRLDLTHADRPTGPVSLTLDSDGIAIGDLPGPITLTQGATETLTVALEAGSVGTHTLTLGVTTPGGEVLRQTLTLPVRRTDPPEARSSRFTLAAGDTFTFDDAVFTGFAPGTGHATLTAGALARFDVAGLLTRLDRYPYGCTEQTASRAMPLLYLSGVARALGLADDTALPARIDAAVARVLTNQASDGGFGLWSAMSGDVWLDAYVTDFLSRARAQGVAVPDQAFRRALDNLSNHINAAADFDTGGEDLAYALHVLAREGTARIGDLRYYADVKADALGSALAMAQLGAALAAYGDPARADRLFRMAQDRLGPRDPATRWRADYGTNLRDTAGVLTLAVDARSAAVDRAGLAAALGAGTDRPSTQEAAWSLLAAHALIADAAQTPLTLNGTPATGPVVEVRADDLAQAPLAIANPGDAPVTLTLTSFGVPDVPPPAGGTGYGIERRYFTLDGAPASPDGVAVGTRLVAVLTIQPAGAVAARLMVDDPLPAGFEIDNPALLRAGDIRSLDWLEVAPDVANAEFLSDRFRAAVDWQSGRALRLAYVVRAVTPGRFHHPAALVEDMYRPRLRARTATGSVGITR